VIEGLVHNYYQNPTAAADGILVLILYEELHIENLSVSIFDFVKLNTDQSSGIAWNRFYVWLANDALHIHRFLHQLRNHKTKVQAPTAPFLAAFYFFESLYSLSSLGRRALSKTVLLFYQFQYPYRVDISPLIILKPSAMENEGISRCPRYQMKAQFRPASPNAPATQVYFGSIIPVTSISYSPTILDPVEE